jgi:fluoride exporter
MALSLLAICAGACLGAVLRWLLGNGLNALFPAIPPGTLVANLMGAYLVGVAVGIFAHHDVLPPQWRLFVITGFLGSLTTFSTFSAEVVALVQQGRWAWVAAAISVHLFGSLLLTLAGLASVEAARRWG